jgi:N-acetylneuraminate synthase
MNGEKLLKAVKTNERLTIEHIDGPYSEHDGLRNLILNRGL